MTYQLVKIQFFVSPIREEWVISVSVVSLSSVAIKVEITIFLINLISFYLFKINK